MGELMADRNVVQSGVVRLRNPSGAECDMGTVEYFHFVVDGREVTLTEADGVARLDADRRPIRQRLAEDDNPRKIAMRLALQHFRRQPEHSAFNQPINYRRRSFV